MPRRLLIWLCLALQLAASTNAAAGLVLCVEDDGRVAIETRLTQLACCGDSAKQDGESAVARDEGCIDAPLSLPLLFAKKSSHRDRAVWTAIAIMVVPSLASAAPALVVRPPILRPTNGTLRALATVVLLA